MTLRLRLTLLYVSLLSGVLLITGALVYGMVGAILLNQVDSTLVQMGKQVVDLIHVTPANQIDIRGLTYFSSNENILFQIWNNKGVLVVSRPGGEQPPLDRDHLGVYSVSFNTLTSGLTRTRVLSIPIVSKNGLTGVLQVGQTLNVIDFVQQVLGIVLVIITLVGAVSSGFMAWVMTGRALAPLQSMMRVASRITRADDLQRRIPLRGSDTDEVGSLIHSFNQTLNRLETLFNSQRRFIADVSHELRTPLTVIKGNVGLMKHIGVADADSLESINLEVDRLTRLVGDLLFLAQAEAGQYPIVITPVALDEVLVDVFQQMHRLVGDKVDLSIAQLEQVQVMGDQDRLKQLILNLVGNAVQYSSVKGKVTLFLRKLEHNAQLIVSDNGSGIPEADLPFIFERFYRAEKSRKRDVSTGFGLGLSIVHWIVQSHNGKIEVNSKEGQGTTFTVWLPLREEEPENEEDIKLESA